MSSHKDSSITPSSVRSYETLEVIAEEGSVGVGWYVLLSGRVGVFKGETKIAEFASRGAVFGEISNILHQPRTARLVALEPTTTMHMDVNLDKLISEHPKVAKTMLVSLAERLAKTTDALCPWSAETDEEKPTQ